MVLPLWTADLVSGTVDNMMRQWAFGTWSMPWQAMSRGYAATAAAAPANQMSLIKQLREKTGSPISDVKSCLESSGWDVDTAYEALRKKGLAAAAKKADRHAAEGLIGCVSDDGGRTAVMVEVNSETDFVARNDLFQSMVGQVAAAALTVPHTSASGSQLPVEQVLLAKLPSGQTVSDAVASIAAQVRENVKLRRAFQCHSSTGCVSTYVHQSPATGLGRIASAVVIQPPTDNDVPLTKAEVDMVHAVGRQLAMHVTGMKPVYLSRTSVPVDVIEKERTILRAHPSTASKPLSVINKMVEGRLSKYYEDTVLLEQRYLLDESVRVSSVMDKLSKSVGRPLVLSSFLRVQCGEGLDSKSKDFATEVAQAVAGQ